MNKTKWSRETSDLTALVEEIIAYWKAIAEKNFKDSCPFSDPSEFEQSWPKTLNNFWFFGNCAPDCAAAPGNHQMLGSLPAIPKEPNHFFESFVLILIRSL